MTTETPRLQAFTQAAAQLSLRLMEGGEGRPLVEHPGDTVPDVFQLHNQISRDLSKRLGLHPEGLGVPYRFTGDPGIETAFVSGMNWNLFMPEHFVLYNSTALRPYFEGGQYNYPAKTDAQFSIPKGAILLYMFAHEITHALHWMSILRQLPRDSMYQDAAAEFKVQLDRFYDDTDSKPFVEGLAELGALIYLCNVDHPVARKFAALHFTTRMIEAAHYMGQSLSSVGDACSDMMNYFLYDDEQVAVHDLAVQCSEHYPDWIVGQQRYEGGWNDPLQYAVGLLRVGDLVCSRGMKIPSLMRLDLSSELVVENPQTFMDL